MCRCVGLREVALAGLGCDLGIVTRVPGVQQLREVVARIGQYGGRDGKRSTRSLLVKAEDQAFGGPANLFDDVFRIDHMEQQPFLIARLFQAESAELLPGYLGEGMAPESHANACGREGHDGTFEADILPYAHHQAEGKQDAADATDEQPQAQEAAGEGMSGEGQRTTRDEKEGRF